ncbi:hypothetical protein NN561_019599 [Cricetulus griseus]
MICPHSPTMRSLAAASEWCPERTQGLSASSVTARLLLLTPHHHTQKAHVPPPRPVRSHQQHYNKQGTKAGVCVPERTCWGQLLTTGAQILAPIRGRRERGGKGRRRGQGRQGRKEARCGAEHRGGLQGTPRNGGAGAGGGRPGRALPSSCPRSGSKRSTAGASSARAPRSPQPPAVAAAATGAGAGSSLPKREGRRLTGLTRHDLGLSRGGRPFGGGRERGPPPSRMQSIAPPAHVQDLVCVAPLTRFSGVPQGGSHQVPRVGRFSQRSP